MLEYARLLPREERFSWPSSRRLVIAGEEGGHDGIKYLGDQSIGGIGASELVQRSCCGFNDIVVQLPRSCWLFFHRWVRFMAGWAVVEYLPPPNFGIYRSCYMGTAVSLS